MLRRVDLFPTCVVDALAPEVGVAAVRVLRRLGWRVGVPEAATCCGQPAWNAGEVEAAATVARTTLRALAESDAEAIVVPAGSCATMIRVFWRELFQLVGDATSARAASDVAARTKEFAEFVAAQPAAASIPAAKTAVEPAVYHHSCHMLRELGIEDQPEALLRRSGADCRASAARGRCCGFGGTFSVKLPETSVAMADDVLDAAVACGAAEVVGCDASCLLHLRARAQHRALGLGFRHLAQVLEERG